MPETFFPGDSSKSQGRKIWFSWWRHQMETLSALLALCAGNSPVPVNSPHKGQWRRALMCSLICTRINDWVNNRETGDLRHHRRHYDVIVMWFVQFLKNVRGSQDASRILEQFDHFNTRGIRASFFSTISLANFQYCPPVCFSQAVRVPLKCRNSKNLRNVQRFLFWSRKLL